MSLWKRFVYVKKVCSFDALASNEYAVLAAGWLRARTSTRVYLALHRRAVVTPFVLLNRPGLLFVDV